MNIQSRDIVERLVSECGYTQKEAELSTRDLQACTPTIQEAFERWWCGRGLDAHLEAQGYTLQRLMDEYGFAVPGAFLMIDWLLREPERASQALAEHW